MHARCVLGRAVLGCIRLTTGDGFADDLVCTQACPNRTTANDNPSPPASLLSFCFMRGHALRLSHREGRSISTVLVSQVSNLPLPGEENYEDKLIFREARQVGRLGDVGSYALTPSRNRGG